MSAIVLVNTSVFVNILDVVGKNENRNGIITAFQNMIETGDHVPLPMAAIIENGNHIAQPCPWPLQQSTHPDKVSLKRSVIPSPS